DSKYDKYLNENNFDKDHYKNIPKENPIEIPKEETKIPENKDIYEDYKKRYIKPPTPKANSNEESKHIYYDENKLYDYENKNNDLKEEVPISAKENLDNNYNKYNTKSTSNILQRSSEEILNNNNPYVRTPRNDKEFFDKYPEYNDDNYLRGIAINRQKQKLFTKDSPIREKLIRRKMLTENPCKIKLI
ncbi:MAG: hypothetical protein MJ252_04155, partial [archaeon]|nr:hypothetical protein [archaeon]